MSVVEQEEPTPPPTVPLHRRLPGGRTLRDGRRLYWWGEIIAVLAFYGIYTFIRNLHHGNPQEAYDHALDIIRWQKSLGINHEQAIQAWALGSRFFIIAANYFYGSLHFIVTGGVMIYLYRKWSDDYPRWRNTIGIATGLALIGFAFFPLMPPRLLDAGGVPVHPPQLRVRGHPGQGPGVLVVQLGRGEQDLQPVRGHAERALRVGVVVRVRAACRASSTCGRRCSRCIYPITTVTVIVVTANHYFLDAARRVLRVRRRLRGRAHLHPRRARGPRGRSTAPRVSRPTDSPGAPAPGSR